MKKKFFTRQKLIGIAVILVCLCFAGILFLIRQSLIGKQDAQMMAQRWKKEKDVTQISCFFSREAGVSDYQIIAFEHMLDNALQEASIKLENANPGARLWADAYSASGTITLSTERTALTLKAKGVGGDFFQFHPQQLQYGNYFSGSDLNSDYIVIDEETAWQLFGGIDVSGKFVTIGGQPHMIAGVIHRPQGKMEKEAGLSDSIVYVSMSTLQKYSQYYGIEHFEIVMPNPIKDFAIQKVKENLSVDENEVIYVENTGRFGIVKSLEVLLQYGYRSMNGRAILFPYWENLARGCEDILAPITLLMVILLIIPATIVFVWAIYAWRHKGWTFGTAVRKGSDLIYQFQSDRTMKKQNRKVQKKNKSENKPIRVFYEEEKENEEKK